MSPERLTRRGRIALTAIAVLACTLVLVVVVRGGREAGCTVESGGGRVELDRDEAAGAAVAVAYNRMAYGDTSAAAAQVRKVTGLRGQDATLLAAALSGESQGALVCPAFGTPSGESDKLGATGLTARAERIRADLRGHFRSMPLGGFEPGGVHSGHMPGSAHYEGRAIDAFSRPISPKNQVRGWALAQYLVARAEHFDIATVIFDGRIWTARRADEGWRPYVVSARGRTQATLNILEHRDHVHVDVFD